MSTKPTKGRPVAQSRVDAARSGSQVPVFAIGVGVLVAVLVVAIVVVMVTGGDDGGSGELAAGDQAFGEVAVTGEALPRFEGDPVSDPAVGQPAPTLEGETPSGEAITIDPADGPMVVFFLAHWCPHCNAEVPRIVEMADGTDEVDGVRFVGVLTDSRPNDPNFPPGDWLADRDWPAPAMVDSERSADGRYVAQDAYGVAGYPFAVAIDGDGNVVSRSSGEAGDDGLRDLFAAAAQ